MWGVQAKVNGSRSCGVAFLSLAPGQTLPHHCRGGTCSQSLGAASADGFSPSPSPGSLLRGIPACVFPAFVGTGRIEAWQGQSLATPLGQEVLSNLALHKGHWETTGVYWKRIPQKLQTNQFIFFPFFRSSLFSLDYNSSALCLNSSPIK